MRTGHFVKGVLLLAVGAAGGGAAYAVASVPDGNGVIHACYLVAGPGATVPTSDHAGCVQLADHRSERGPGRLADAPSPVPLPNEATLNWNTAGPQGAPGTPGTPGTPPRGAPAAPGPPGADGKTLTIAGGNTLTISGGQVITVGGGNGLTVISPPVTERGPRSRPRQHHRRLESFDFDVRALSFATTQGGTHATGGGGGAGKVSVHDISITKEVDKASPKLSLACANGTHIKKATITLRKAGKVYLTYTLTDVLISSVQFSGSGGGEDVPMESITSTSPSSAIQYAKQSQDCS